MRFLYVSTKQGNHIVPFTLEYIGKGFIMQFFCAVLIVSTLGGNGSFVIEYNDI